MMSNHKSTTTLIVSFWAVWILHLSALGSCTAQDLSAEYLQVKLPYPAFDQAAFYDGEDTIYLLGNFVLPGNQILAFSISSETIELVGSLPSSGNGKVHEDGLGNAYFFGSRTVTKFDPVESTTSVVATLPASISWHTSFKNNNTVYIMGGWDQDYDLWAFDLQTFNVSTVATLPYNTFAGTSVAFENKGYTFDNSGTHRALQLNLETLIMEKVGPSTLPLLILYPTSVSDSNFIYIIGGYFGSDEPNRMQGIFQFDPRTFENTWVTVENLQVDTIHYYEYSPATVFVPSRNRIYGFGGSVYNGTEVVARALDDIFYIDLTPLQPPTTQVPTTTDNSVTTTNQPITTLNPDFFTCDNRTDGMYPHPTDCAMFIGCHEEEMDFFTCPSPLLFDPVTQTCNYPDQVDCEITCLDRPDGTYPHPHDCSLFIICRDGTIGIFKCPPPLLFHPDVHTCVYPDQAECQVVGDVS